MSEDSPIIYSLCFLSYVSYNKIHIVFRSCHYSLKYRSLHFMITKYIFPEAYLSLNLPLGGPSWIISRPINGYLGFKAIPESPFLFKGFIQK